MSVILYTGLKYVANMPQIELISKPNMAIIWHKVGEKLRGLEMSEKRDNFIRLAEGRVTRAIDSIRVIGNLANRSNYEYSEEEVKKIITVLQSEINDLKNQFAPKGRKTQRNFKLNG
jgi:hypothetical protein